MYKIESDFEYKGYRCVTIFTDQGYRCGYVGIDSSNPLYGKRGSDELDISFDDIKDKEFDKEKTNIFSLLSMALSDDHKSVQLDFYFNVHGGITFTDNDHPINNGLWWLGFDCAHYNDGKDIEKTKEYFGDNERVKSRIEEWSLVEEYGTIRSLEYVKQECKNLVDQIIEYCEYIGNTIRCCVNCRYCRKLKWYNTYDESLCCIVFVDSQDDNNRCVVEVAEDEVCEKFRKLI